MTAEQSGITMVVLFIVCFMLIFLIAWFNGSEK